MFNFLFKKSVKKEKEEKIKKEFYVVLHKNTQIPLGVYSSLERAKLFGEKDTYHTCYILKFELDQKCKFLNDPVYENKY